MSERTKLVECSECDGYGRAEYANAASARCDACNGSGEVRRLMTEEEIEQERLERIADRRDQWEHDAYDREGDR
jgi:DnaJ-class molecular chaperone